jgi:galactokinase
MYRFTASGRTELCGNHTDHQNGCILAASVDLQICADVKRNNDDVIRIYSEGYGAEEADTCDLEYRPEERGTTAALVRGMAKAFADRGAKLSGFDAIVVSQVPKGSGLSSSAAFEVLLGRIMNTLFMDGQLDAVDIAKIGRWAENQYFGKPCGLMDQLAISVGGVILADFADPEKPVVEQLPLDLSENGYAMCIIDTGGNHAELTDEYAAITEEFASVCACFGKTRLREIPEQVFMEGISQLRGRVSDRSILRAIHFYEENRRVRMQADAIRSGDFGQFLRLCRASGRSSWMYLQNIYPAGSVQQPVAVALAVCNAFLGERGACRVHGGGFAGTIQAFVPLDMVSAFKEKIEEITGADTCCILQLGVNKQEEIR